uniref:Uncharacterized protein n=1 Tax=viral metagenome TaxID=1070528 RepID=A0A6C0EDM5_9ZZZZ
MKFFILYPQDIGPLNCDASNITLVPSEYIIRLFVKGLTFIKIKII